MTPARDVVLLQHATDTARQRERRAIEREHQAELYYRLGLDALRDVELLPTGPLTRRRNLVDELLTQEEAAA